MGLDSCGEEEQRSAVRGVDGIPAPVQSSVLFPEDFSGELSVYTSRVAGGGSAVSVQTPNAVVPFMRIRQVRHGRCSGMMSVHRLWNRG